MRPIRSAPAVLVLLFLVALSGGLAAQEPPRAHYTAVTGLYQFELDGNGLAPAVALRAGTPISTVLLVEGGLLAARPGQDSGTSTMLIPEIQVQLSLPFAAVNPYMGLGAGAAIDLRGSDAGGTRTDLTISGALGFRAWITERFAAVGEFRARGIGADFVRTSAEYMIGGSIRR